MEENVLGPKKRKKRMLARGSTLTRADLLHLHHQPAFPPTILFLWSYNCKSGWKKGCTLEITLSFSISTVVVNELHFLSVCLPSAPLHPVSINVDAFWSNWKINARQRRRALMSDRTSKQRKKVASLQRKVSDGNNKVVCILRDLPICGSSLFF